MIKRRRRANLKHIIHAFTTEEWKAKLARANGVCPKCKKEKVLSLDHIYPVSKAEEDYKATGIKRVYTIKDVQPLCVPCNISKFNKVVISYEQD